MRRRDVETLFGSSSHSFAIRNGGARYGDLDGDHRSPSPNRLNRQSSRHETLTCSSVHHERDAAPGSSRQHASWRRGSAFGILHKFCEASPLPATPDCRGHRRGRRRDGQRRAEARLCPIMRMSRVRVQHDGDEPNTLAGCGVTGPPL
jgi:hypothetical protein